MKKKISKKEFDKLSPELQKLYKPVDADGDEFKLELEDDEDVSGLKSALEKTKEERRKLKEELSKYKDAEESSSLELEKKRGDVEAIENSYKAKLKALKDEHKQAITQLTNGFTNHIKEAEVAKLAGEMFKSTKLGVPHIRDRVTVELDDDFKPTVRILDELGKPSSSTLDDFKKELLTDKELSPILKVSSASGGGPRFSASSQEGAPDRSSSQTAPSSSSTGVVPAGFYQLPHHERLAAYDHLPDPPEPNA